MICVHKVINKKLVFPSDKKILWLYTVMDIKILKCIIHRLCKENTEEDETIHD